MFHRISNFLWSDFEQYALIAYEIPMVKKEVADPNLIFSDENGTLSDVEKFKFEI